MHHDARWRQEFEQTRSGLLQACQGRVVTVEHIGSTAIGGIIAQPVIDAVAVIADPVDFRDAVLLIEGLNFITVSSPAWMQRFEGHGQQAMLSKPRHGEATHRLYLVTQGSILLEQTIRFRDRLRANPEMAIGFETAKVNAWRRTEGVASDYEAAMASIFDDFQSMGGQPSD
ncbi:GrpB family protein [Allorhodopirellula solitaria]|uniref:Dephospho-CoA kinase/protein folding accessory domain-containing protein n=1 Tax=Allorhodopirellula solitaria TaxID=2527987 RepID=A0A5C5XRW6_9BACT|nr:GrpB family protein [Allorhodopirellula solitaria]TWT64775.1 dephospho-CoA kinase/protein folding accessory domain-containing protein [Allorhodopirellula solitaria]